MGRVHAAKSGRMSSKQRHKIDRKKREHKRDLKKAAKQMKKNGLGPKRSKKMQQMAKLALKVSNVHPDKENILSRVLQIRETARVEKATERQRRIEDETAADDHDTVPSPAPSSSRQTLFIPTKLANSFGEQFNRAVNSLVFASEDSAGVKVPCAVFVITLDSRFAVQCLPWSLLDAILDAASAYEGKRRVLLLFTLTKVDLISAPALATQVSLVGDALAKRYGDEIHDEKLVSAIVPFSVNVDKTGKHFLRILRQFQYSDCCSVASGMKTNLDGKVCAFVIGLPNTGRRSLCRHLTTKINEEGTSTVPMRAAQLQSVRVALSPQADSNEEETVTEVKFALPNAKSVTLVQFSEDAELIRELRTISGGDVFFRSNAFVEKVPEPEAIGVVLFGGVADKLSLAQAFCQPYAATSSDSKLSEEDQELRASERFLRELGQTVRREKGFHLSPLFVAGAGTMGKTSSSDLTGNVTFTSGQQRSQATLLDASYSNATPSKLVRISTLASQLRKNTRIDPAVKRGDSRNAFRLGARTFIRELCQSKNIPWAVMRASGKVPVTEKQIAKASEIFNLSLSSGSRIGVVEESKGMEHLTAIIAAISAVMKEALPFLPNGVVEMDPDFIVPPVHHLSGVEVRGVLERTGDGDTDESAEEASEDGQEGMEEDYGEEEEEEVEEESGSNSS